MTEYKRLEYLKSNITLILLFVYSISFINYFIYYKSFNIPIFSYIGLNDLIFFCFEYVLQIIFIIIIWEFILSMLFALIYILYEKGLLLSRKKFKLYMISSKKNKERINTILNKNYYKFEIDFKLTIIIFGIFIIAFIPYKLLILPAYFIYFIYIFDIAIKDKTHNLSFTFAIATIIFFMITTTLFSSYNKRYKKDNYVISFQEDSRYITTDKKNGYLNYLGETSTNIFLYDIKNKTSKIYSKSNLTNIEIKNTNEIDKFILNLKKNVLIKSFIEMFKEK